jgi:hypothetical protein
MGKKKTKTTWVPMVPIEAPIPHHYGVVFSLVHKNSGKYERKYDSKRWIDMSMEDFVGEYPDIANGTEGEKIIRQIANELEEYISRFILSEMMVSALGVDDPVALDQTYIITRYVQPVKDGGWVPIYFTLRSKPMGIRSCDGIARYQAHVQFGSMYQYAWWYPVAYC